MHQDILNCYTKFMDGTKIIMGEDLRDLEIIRKGITYSKENLQELRVLLRKHDFHTIEGEIHFFKSIKPAVNGYLKFFVYIYRLELHFPITSFKIKQKYLKMEMCQIETKRLKYVEFYRYYKNKETSLDHYYFVRQTERIESILDTTHFFSDPEFSTSHDNIYAKFIKYEILESHLKYLAITLIREKSREDNNTHKPIIYKDSNWTSSITDLVELIYSLKAARAINNGSKELNQMILVVEQVFGIKIKNHSNIYQKIKYRSRNTTKFLDHLKLSLLSKIASED
ncbi:MAG: RteC domain-containing protein [Mesonia sp.]|uniref:RteC domain-containing protein n=1 Tax=Mesonia sp. TaxID=1960830 RepID=UPI003F9E7D1B